MNTPNLRPIIEQLPGITEQPCQFGEVGTTIARIESKPGVKVIGMRQGEHEWTLIVRCNSNTRCECP